MALPLQKAVTAMTRRSIFASFVVAFSVVMVAGWAVAAAPKPTYPKLAFESTSASSGRILVNTAWVGSSLITVSGTGTGADTFTLAGGKVAMTELTGGTFAASTTGTIAVASTASVPFTFQWTSDATAGPLKGSITLTDTGKDKVVMALAGTALGERSLVVVPLGTTTTPFRVMASGGTGTSASATTTFGTGAKGLDDNHATRLAINSTATMTSPGGDVTVGYAPSPLVSLFNAKQQKDTLNLSFSGLGAHTGSFELAPTGGTGLVVDGEDSSVKAVLQPETLSYNVDVLQNRTFTVSSLSNIRIMAKTPITAVNGVPLTITDNSGLTDSQGTRVNVNAAGKATDKATGITVAYPKGTGKTDVFGGATTSEPITVTFTTLGNYSSSLDVGTQGGKAALLANGEVVKTGGAAGAAAPSATLAYTNVSVLEQRKLVVGTPVTTMSKLPNGDGVLSGDYYLQVPVTSKDDDSHGTRVTVGGTVVGPAGNQLMVPATTISSASAPVYGLALYPTGATPKAKPSVTLPVQSAEAASVGDPGKYKSLSVKYAAVPSNVGLAALGSSGAFSSTPLAGFVPQGFTLGSFAAGSTGNVSLSSSVASMGSGNSNAIGSQAQILTSTKVAADTLVTMAWRQRSAYESGQSSTPSGTDATLPGGIKFLTSDVVSTSINSPLVYAMQMSFSPAVISAMEANKNINTPAGEFAANSLYLGEINTQTNTWQNAVLGNASGSKTLPGVDESLATFLNSKLAGLSGSAADAMLQSLLGSWGVDTANAEAWAIIDHGGTMAVVPEPTTALLLLSAGGVMLWYRRWRRRSGCANG
jgi:hypothetical protein